MDSSQAAKILACELLGFFVLFKDYLLYNASVY